jgi:SRSO17 transposase
MDTDDTALPKKGEQSVGVAPQYASALDKNANCQTLVSLTLASGEVPVTVGLRLFLPESWTSDPARLNRARVPEERRVYRRGLKWAKLAKVPPAKPVESQRRESAFKQKVYPANVAMIFPVPGRGRPRKRHIPDVTSIAAQSMLQTTAWRKISWRRGTKGRLTARFAALRVRVADGPLQRIGAMGAQHLPGEEAGSSASIARQESASITCPTCPPRRHLRNS